MNILDFVNAAILNPPVKDTRIARSFYPSEASVYADIGDGPKVYGRCLRYVYYRWTYLGDVEKDSVQSERVKNVGDLLHREEILWYMKCGIWLGDEISFMLCHENFDISGRIDAFVKNPSTGKPIGIEIKTVSGYRGLLGTINETRKNKLFPRIKDILQVVIYMHYYRDVVDTWKIVYIDRGNGYTKEHTIFRMSDGRPCVSEDYGQTTLNITFQDIASRFSHVYSCVKNKTLPERDYCRQYSDDKLKFMFENGMLTKRESEQMSKYGRIEKGDPECSYCKYRKVCYMDDNRNNVCRS